MKEGDRNTRFFHVRATHWAKKNFIEGLHDDNEIWTTNSKGIFHVAQNYFKNLFTSEGNNYFDNIVGVIPQCITPDMNEFLVKKVTEKEVLDAIGQTDPRKAPKIDGLFGMFYKENWEVVGRDILRMYDEMLNGNRGWRILTRRLSC